MEAGLDRAGAGARAGHDLVDGQVQVEAQDDDLALVMRKAADGPGQRVAPAQLVAEIGPRRGPTSEDQLGVEAGDRAALRPTPIAADVDHDAAEPGLETGRITQLAEAPPGRERGVVGGVLRCLAVAQHQRGVVVGPVQRGAVDEVGEGGRPRPIGLPVGPPHHRFQVCLRIVHDHLTWLGRRTFKSRAGDMLGPRGRYDAREADSPARRHELEAWG